MCYRLMDNPVEFHAKKVSSLQQASTKANASQAALNFNLKNMVRSIAAKNALETLLQT